MKGTSSNEEMDGYAPVHKAKNRDLAMIPGLASISYLLCL